MPHWHNKDTLVRESRRFKSLSQEHVNEKSGNQNSLGRLSGRKVAAKETFCKLEEKPEEITQNAPLRDDRKESRKG